MVRVDGIEPTTSAWKADVLPLNYTRLEKGNTRLSGIWVKTGIFRYYENIGQFSTLLALGKHVINLYLTYY